ncbi:MAG: DNA recombination protein RmuC [Alphaproteobacteria bacterium]|nr:DNA recombination protein RmuC [Alphaproteobacteria bacterium]
MDFVTILLLVIIALLGFVVYRLSQPSAGGQDVNDIKNDITNLKAEITRIEASVKAEFVSNRKESQDSSQETRKELSESFTKLSAELRETITASSTSQKEQLEAFAKQLKELTTTNEQKINEMQDKLLRAAKESRDELTKTLKELQTGNQQKLDEMRKTVDEKLQSTIEKRFNESFTLISERLDKVHQGLGEMQNLASGVGDLKKVLTNVSTRGSFGEVQLGTILEQYLSPDQYEKNAAVKKNSQERVDFIVKFPGRADDNTPVLLPIDSKFPNEDYQRLQEARENDADAITSATKQFESSVKRIAKDIAGKYINPPTTTDFAIMFVPTEGLYAEIVSRVNLFETLHNEYKIVVVGPTNIVALLNSLQMGFNTLAIEKHSSEVWELLGGVKREFGKFGEVLDAAKRKIDAASKSIDDAGVRTRAIERKLQRVETLPAATPSPTNDSLADLPTLTTPNPDKDDGDDE